MKVATKYIAVKKCIFINVQKENLSIESFCFLKMMSIVEKVLKKLKNLWKLPMIFTDKIKEEVVIMLCQ
jgi:hypothetical protein